MKNRKQNPYSENQASDPLLIGEARVWLGRMGWLALGVLCGFLLSVMIGAIVLELGRRYVSNIWGRAIQANPKTLQEVEALLGANHRFMIFQVGRNAGGVVRYRFLYGEDIDVVFDGKRQIVEIRPTFAGSWGRPWPLIHRVRREKIVINLPSSPASSLPPAPTPPSPSAPPASTGTVSVPGDSP